MSGRSKPWKKSSDKIKKMKILRNILFAGMLSLSFLSCHPEETVELTGTVVSENYQKGEGFAKRNQYSFAINTEYGRKVIEIIDNSDDSIMPHQMYSKESADSLITLGSKIKINVNKRQIGSNSFRFNVDDFFRAVKLEE